MGVSYWNYYSDTHSGKVENDIQTEVIRNLEYELNSLRKIVEDLIKKEEEIRQDLGEPKYRKLSKRRLIKQKQQSFTRGYPESYSDASATHQLVHELSYLKGTILDIERRFRRDYSIYQQYLVWYQHTPSIWPVYGYVRSGFGWRTHPLKRQSNFIKGWMFLLGRARQYRPLQMGLLSLLVGRVDMVG